MAKDTRWVRNCPSCETKLFYASKQALERQMAKNTSCRSCSIAYKPDTDLANKIAMAHSQGLGNREIAQRIGCHHRTVFYHLRRLGLITNNPRGKPPIEVSETMAICSCCGKEVPKTDFALLRSYADGRKLSKCRTCRKEQGYKNLSENIQAFIRDKENRFKARARKNEIVYDLPDGYLMALYEKQEGKCFYTDLSMLTRVGKGYSPYALSVDRIDPNEGYIVNNVVLCTNKANSIKQNMTLEELSKIIPSWHQRIVEMWRSLGLICLQVADGDF